MFRLLFLGNGWADCVEIWYALGNPLATAYVVVTDGGISARAHVHTALLYLGGGYPRVWSRRLDKINHKETQQLLC